MVSSSRFQSNFEIREIVTNPSYAEQWQKMRRIAHRLVVAYLIFPVGFMLNHYFIDPTNRLSVSLAVLLVASSVFLIWTVHQYRNWPCPRCRHPWQQKGPWPQWEGFWDMFLRHKCRHCGLELP